MADASCFHNLKEGGIPRQLAEGLSARVFPGEHLMLSVVEIQPGSVSPVHSHANEQWGVCLEGEWIRIQDGVEHHGQGGRLLADAAPRAARRPRHRQAGGGARHLLAAARGVQEGRVRLQVKCSLSLPGRGPG